MGKRKQCLIMLSSGEKELLRAFAERRGLSMSGAARMLIREGMERRSASWADTSRHED